VIGVQHHVVLDQDDQFASANDRLSRRFDHGSANGRTRRFAADGCSALSEVSPNRCYPNPGKGIDRISERRYGAQTISSRPMWPECQRVGNIKNNDPSLVEPVG
jgi:hypothetical protein